MFRTNLVYPENDFYCSQANNRDYFQILGVHLQSFPGND